MSTAGDQEERGLIYPSSEVQRKPIGQVSEHCARRKIFHFYEVKERKKERTCTTHVTLWGRIKLFEIKFTWNVFLNAVYNRESLENSLCY